MNAFSWASEERSDNFLSAVGGRAAGSAAAGTRPERISGPRALAVSARSQERLPFYA